MFTSKELLTISDVTSLTIFFFDLPNSWCKFLHVSHRIKSRLSVDSTSTPLQGSPTHNYRSAVSTPTRLDLDDWSSSNLAQTPSSIHSNGSCHTLAPSAGSIHSELHTDMNENNAHSCHSSSAKHSERRGCSRIQMEVLPRPNFEPKNLLSLFEEITP